MAGKGEGSRGGKIIGHTKSGNPIYAPSTGVMRGAAAVGIGTGLAVHSARKSAGPLAAKAEQRSIKFGKQAGRMLGKMGPLNKKGSNFEKAAKVFHGSKAPDATVRGGKFALRALNSYHSAEKAERVGIKAGKLSERYAKAAKILRKIG